MNLPAKDSRSAMASNHDGIVSSVDATIDKEV